jgi:hypothetical protein
MSLTPGVDTFVTLVEADAYFAARLDALTWADYDEQEKEASLRGGYDRITASCLCDFADIQAPDGTYPYTPENAPPNIKKAQCEWAMGLSKAEDVDELSETDLSQLTAGPVTMKFTKEKSEGYTGLNDFIKSMLRTGGCDCDFNPDESVSGDVTNGTVIF